MTPLRPTNLRLEEELLEGMRALRAREGIPVSEQVRRAISAYLESKGVKVKKTAKRGARTPRKA